MAVKCARKIAFWFACLLFAEWSMEQTPRAAGDAQNTNELMNQPKDEGKDVFMIKEKVFLLFQAIYRGEAANAHEGCARKNASADRTLLDTSNTLSNSGKQYTRKDTRKVQCEKTYGCDP